MTPPSALRAKLAKLEAEWADIDDEINGLRDDLASVEDEIAATEEGMKATSTFTDPEIERAEALYAAAHDPRQMKLPLAAA
jgi:septal ring factor EnvC (AmiA/AmiB activator)